MLIKNQAKHFLMDKGKKQTNKTQFRTKVSIVISATFAK